MSTFRGPDPKPAKRIKDPKVAKRLHAGRVVCALCGRPGSLHHVYKRTQGGDDLVENFVGLCGDGVTGHHGRIEHNEVATRILFGRYLTAKRPDVIRYIQGKLGEEEGKAWLAHRFYIAL